MDRTADEERWEMAVREVGEPLATLIIHLRNTSALFTDKEGYLESGSKSRLKQTRNQDNPHSDIELSACRSRHSVGTKQKRKRKTRLGWWWYMNGKELIILEGEPVFLASDGRNHGSHNFHKKKKK